MRNTLTTQADSVQAAVKQFLAVPEGEKVHDLQHFDLHSWPQMWGNTAGGFEGIGGASMTMENVTCIVRGNRCCVYFGGRFAYEGNMQDEWFAKGFRAKQILGAATFQRYKAEYGTVAVGG